MTARDQGVRDAGQNVRYSRSGAVATLTLDRPPVNAFSTGMWNDFSAALHRSSGDAGVSVLVITAAGSRCFSAGADVKEIRTLDPDADQARLRLVSGGLEQLATMPIPVICAVNGPAVGGGVNLTTLCDYRIASTEATFSLPEIDHGRTGGGGSFLRRLGVPAGTIRHLLYTGRRLSPQEALAAHLVDEVVAPERLLARAGELAEEMAARPREALIAMKAAISAAESASDWQSGYLAAEQVRRAGSREER